MSDPFILDNDPFTLVVPAAANVPASTIPAPDWLALLGRVTDVEGLGMVDLTDVDLAGVAAGMVLIADTTTDPPTWRPGTVAGAIERVDNNAGFTADGVKRLSFRWGLTASLTPGGDVQVYPLFGTATNTVAEGNHTHSIRADVPIPIPVSGTLSGGTRPLASANITGLDPARSYVITGALKLDLRGEGTGAGTTLMSITINGNTRNRFGESRTVAGVDMPYDMRHPGASGLITGVSSVGVSAAIQVVGISDPVNVKAGELVIAITSNR